MFIRQYTETKDRSDKYTQNFDRKKIFISKGGQTYNLYDMIQAAREDTEIYPTLEKYGNLQVMERPAELVYKDLTEAKDLQGILNQEIKLKTLFDNLPFEDRNVFNNDFYEFREKGLAFYEKRAQAEIEAKQKERETLKNTPQKVEIVNNGGKE